MARKRRFRFGLPIVFAGRPPVGGVGLGCQPSGQVRPVKVTFDTNTLSGVPLSPKIRPYEPSNVRDPTRCKEALVHQGTSGSISP